MYLHIAILLYLLYVSSSCWQKRISKRFEKNEKENISLEILLNIF